jgi:hypothetical protein
MQLICNPIGETLGYLCAFPHSAAGFSALFERFVWRTTFDQAGKGNVSHRRPAAVLCAEKEAGGGLLEGPSLSAQPE